VTLAFRERPAFGRDVPIATEDCAGSPSRRLTRRILGTESFLRGIEARQAQLRAARDEVTRLRARHALHALPPVTEPRRQWDAMDLIQRRALIARILDVVFVKPGRRK
jgi:hypothetical protein